MSFMGNFLSDFSLCPSSILPNALNHQLVTVLEKAYPTLTDATLRKFGKTETDLIGNISSDRPMGSGFNKIPVKDLLNESPPRGRVSHRPTQDKPDVFTFICNSTGCDRRFASQEALLAHQRRSHAAPTSFVCPHCSSSFSTSPNLNKHVRSVHEKVRPFRCEMCSASFGFKDSLNRHVSMVHDQARPFPCQHCSLKFKTKAHLVKHSLALHPEAQK